MSIFFRVFQVGQVTPSVSLVRPPLRKLDKEGLPVLGSYQVALVRNGSNPVNDALASYVKETFADLR